MKLWTEGTGIPLDAHEPVSNLYTKIVSLANEFKIGRMPREEEVSDWQGQEWELYLENLPKSVEASQVALFSLSFKHISFRHFQDKLALIVEWTFHKTRFHKISSRDQLIELII